MIIDFGATHTRITPVVDGFALNKTSFASHRGGNHIDQLLLPLISSSSNSRKRSRENSTNSLVVQPWFLSSPRTAQIPFLPSFVQFHSLNIVRDLKQWMSLIPSASEQPDAVRSVISIIPPYELPDRTVVNPSAEICLCAQKVFFESAPSQPVPESSAHEEIKTAEKSTRSSSGGRKSTKGSGIKPESVDRTQAHPPPENWNSLPIHEMIWKTILKCDVDIRRELLNNMILVGGGSLIDGMSPRLLEELSKVTPSSMKIKTPIPGMNVEKHHAAWIGGSILSICGSFQQLWISKQEYDEHGPSVYRKKGQH